MNDRYLTLIEDDTEGVRLRVVRDTWVEDVDALVLKRFPAKPLHLWTPQRPTIQQQWQHVMHAMTISSLWREQTLFPREHFQPWWEVTLTHHQVQEDELHVLRLKESFGINSECHDQRVAYLCRAYEAVNRILARGPQR